MGFLWFSLLNNWLFLSGWLGSLFGRFLIFFFFKFVVDVSNVSSSSTLFSWSILSSGSTSSIKSVAFSDTFVWSSCSIVSNFFSVVSNSYWDFFVSCSDGCGYRLIAEFFLLSSLFVGCYKKWKYLFWLCQFFG